MNKYETQDSKSRKPKREVTYVNYSIRGRTVRVIQDGCAPKVMKTDEAISTAQSNGLDLVQVAYDAANHIPVCKILDYGKFKYEQSKREKEAKKAARANAVEVKQVQFSITTDDNDKTRLIEQAKGFLEAGDKVKLTIRFRNRRESANLNFAKDVMKSLLALLDGYADLDSAPALSGRELSCLLRGRRK